ncbi:probable ADP-ribosylation factor GTPase-activating protein AGD14 isoform X2 [Oryza brachyantha]|uniref:probable ADP-ribosylation factor GTPase-activating protein AGD14 isoform X2 n=1 Tax=Oryza brachyantha TaxID=4533 RepID=UPI0007766EB2|nr:probable ADP-ribosylation factor GTPase-activating protein AGD14 isoform X2 [Oryza brachyantha]
MASRLKEDERNERIIRGLLKLPANKRCINCNNLGPQYVCTNFWTFVCTNCSGAHREFTHRVKSVSMAKFTAQEVSALQEGGNERAREIFFKEWDPQRNSYPDSSNADKLRNFIKHVYVERRYTGERSADRPPRGKDDKDEISENRRSDGNWGSSRSPPYNESYSDRRSYSGRSDDRNSRYSYGERSPGYEQNDYKKSPRYFDVDDRSREDRSGKTTPVQRFEDRRSSEPQKLDNGSPNYQKETDGSSPVVRPVRDILGDNAPQLRVGEPPKPHVVRPIYPPRPVDPPRPIDPPRVIDPPRANGPPRPNGTRAIEPPLQRQRTSTASSIGSSEGTSEQIKAANTISLIDFSADSEPVSVPLPQSTPTSQQQPANAQPVQPVNAPAQQPVLEQGTNASSVISGGGDWASFGSFGQQQTPQASNSVNPLESALAQLSFSETPSASNASAFPASVSSTSVPNDGGSFFGASLGVSGHQASTGISVHGSSVQQTGLAGPTVVLPSQVSASSRATSGIPEAAPSTDSRSIGRKELPADIFTSLYPQGAMGGWQRTPQFGMGYAMPYQTPMGMQAYPLMAFAQPAYQQPQQHVYPQHAYPQPAKASNPFDLGNEPAPIQAHTQPLPGPLGASAGMTPTTLHGTSSFGVLQQQPQQLYQSPAPPNHYMMQQVPNMAEQLPNSMLPMQQGGLGSLSMGFDQQAAPRYPHPNTPPSYGSAGGNPFG